MSNSQRSASGTSATGLSPSLSGIRLEPFGRVLERVQETPLQDRVRQRLFAARGDHQGDRQRVHQQGAAVPEAVLVVVRRGFGVEDRRQVGRPEIAAAHCTAPR